MRDLYRIRIFTSFFLFHVLLNIGLWSFSSLNLQASNKNKEKFILCEENFHTEKIINFKGLYDHIHYSFKNETLLQESLYPLLPPDLQHTRQKFEQLEFLGDAVLGLITRERILDLFPQEKRDVHNKLYVALTCNKILAEAYQHNLRIERYLPYPGANICKYCDVVEALIGAIFQDDQQNSLMQVRRFTMFILNDHVLEQKWQNIKNNIEEDSTIQKEGLPLSTLSLPLLPSLETLLDTLSQTHPTKEMSPKSILGLILAKTSQDQPEYVISLGKSPEGTPGFIAHVIGSQIGYTISGFGLNRIEAEEEAARQAINFLAKREFISQNSISSLTQSYTKVINEYCQLQDIKLAREFVLTSAMPQFVSYIRLGDEVIGKGQAKAKKKAEELAAFEAYQYLVSKRGEQLNYLPSNNYRMTLREWAAQKKIVDLQFIQEDSPSTVPQIQYHLKIGETIISKGIGASKNIAREHAFQASFDYFLEKQQKASQVQFKKLEKKVLTSLSLVPDHAETTLSLSVPLIVDPSASFSETFNSVKITENKTQSVAIKQPQSKEATLNTSKKKPRARKRKNKAQPLLKDQN